jgi:hypothetical protein
MDDKMLWYAIGVLTTSAITGAGVIASKRFPRIGDGSARTITGLAVGASALLFWYLHSRSVPIHADKLRLLVPYAAITAWALIIGNIWFTVRGVRVRVAAIGNQESHPGELAAQVDIAPLAAKIDGLVKTTAHDIGELFGGLDEHARLISELAKIQAVNESIKGAHDELVAMRDAQQKQLDEIKQDIRSIKGRPPSFRGQEAPIKYTQIALLSAALELVIADLGKVKTKVGI